LGVATLWVVTEQNITNILLSNGNGSRGLVQFDLIDIDGEPYGHVVNVINIEGVVYFVDAQADIAVPIISTNVATPLFFHPTDANIRFVRTDGQQPHPVDFGTILP
jgi:hypothetical protein